MSEEHEHHWAAAILFQLNGAEASVVAEFPDDLTSVAASAPSETVGPFCLDCLTFSV